MPDFQLDDKQLKQLDGNIKQMISAGASQDDVMRYASDFKNQFGVKKKDQIGVGTGELSSPIPSKLPSKGVLEQGLEFAQKGFTVPQAKPEKVAKQQKVSIAPPIFGYIPEVTPEDEQSTLADFTSSIIKGQLQGKVANILSAGKRPSEQELGEIAQLQTDLQSFPQTRAEKLYQEKGLSGLFKENPKLGVEFVAQTMGNSLSSLFEASKRTVPVAVGAGAAAGAPFGGIGAIPGAATGLVAGQLTAGYNISTSQDILNSLSDNGVDISNKDSLIKAFSDEKKMAKIRETATKYGVPILIFDAATAGLAGKLGAGAIGKSLSKKLLAGAGEAGIQMTGGAGGELAAQLASGKKVNWDDIALEAIAEVPGGVTEVGAGIISERAKTSSSNKILSKQIAAQGPKDGIQDAVVNLNRDLSNKVISPEQHQEGLQFIEKAAQAFEKLPSELNRENKGKSIELLVERDDLKNFNESLIKQKQGLDEAYHAGIDEQVKANEEKIKNINSELYNISKLPQDEVVSPRVPLLREEGVSVISPEENIAPEVVNVENVANVVMPEQNVPGTAIEISAKDAVVEKPKLSDKLASFKEKYNLVSDVALKGMETKKVNQEAAKIVPMDKESAVLAWLAGKGNELNWKAINEAAGRTETARLNVGKDYATQEVKLRDYASKERNKGLTLRDAAHKIWEDVSKRNPNITSDQVEEALLTAIRENPSRSDAARNLISISGAETAPVSIEEGEQAYYERKGEEAPQEGPISLESGFVPFQEEEGLEEAPFAVQERAAEEVNDMKDIVKDLVEEGVLNLNTIKNRVSKELGYDSKRLRETVSKAYQEYTKESTPKEVTSGVIGKVGSFLSDIFGGKAKDRVFVAKDGKSLMAKYAQISETGGRVEFQATLPNGEKVTAKPVDASVVNGFYSPLELQINQMKQDKMPAKQWLDKLRGEEAKWTGLSDWLSQQEGSLTKENIKNWLQENQIEINEIVKGKSQGLTKEQTERLKNLEKLDAEYPTGAMEDIEAGSYDEYLTLLNIRDKSTSKDLLDLQEKSERLARSAQQKGDKKLADKYWEDSHRYTKRHEVLELSMEGEGGILAPTKFSMYQLEGDSKDYTEILITKPNKEFDIMGGRDYYKSLGYTEEQYWKLSQEEKDRITDEWSKVGKYENLAKKLFNDNYVKLRQSEQGKVREEFKKLDDQREYKKYGHFNEANILVHLRMNTRIDDKKNKILFLEEVQSDWGQDARKLGTDEELPQLEKKLKDLGYIIKDNKVYQESDAYIDDKPLLVRKYPNDLVGEARILASRYENSVPSAPFISNTNDWAKLGLKVALKEAVNIGADKISWTTGAQQVERYEDNIRKQVDKIESKRYDAVDRVEIIAYKNGQVVFEGLVPTDESKVYISGKDVGLEDIVGKDMAQKIKTGDRDQTFEGDSLTIGGSGMKGFYGSPSENNLGIIGNLAKKLFKQEPSTIKLNLVDEGKENSNINRYRRMLSDFNNELDFLGEKEQGVYENERGERYSINKAEVLDNKKAVINKIQSMEKRLKAKKASIQYSIDITPELKAQVEVGLPLFMSTPDGADVLGFTFGNKIYLNGEKLNPNTPIHEAGHVWTEWVKQNDPKVYEKGIELVKNSDYLKEVKSSKFYQDQAKKLGSKAEIELYYQQEALAMAIGDKGAQFVTESKRASFKDWLNELWSKIKSIAGFRDITPEELQDLTFEQFTQMAVKDILGDQFESRSVQEVYDMLPQGKKLRQNKEKILIKNNFENIVNELIKKKKIQKIC